MQCPAQLMTFLSVFRSPLPPPKLRHQLKPRARKLRHQLKPQAPKLRHLLKPQGPELRTSYGSVKAETASPRGKNTSSQVRHT